VDVPYPFYTSFSRHLHSAMVGGQLYLYHAEGRSEDPVKEYLAQGHGSDAPPFLYEKSATEPPPARVVVFYAPWW